VGPSLQNPEKTTDKFAGSLIFRVGPSLQNPKKTAEKSDFQNILRARPSKSREIAEKSAFREFFGSPKNRRKPRKIQISKPFSLQENREEFLDEPVL
jgi:hypothetical protein